MNTCPCRGYIIIEIQQQWLNLRRIIIFDKIISKVPNATVISTITSSWTRRRIARLAEELRTILESEMKPAQVQGLLSNLKQEQIPIRR